MENHIERYFTELWKSVKFLSQMFKGNEINEKLKQSFTQEKLKVVKEWRSNQTTPFVSTMSKIYNHNNEDFENDYN